AAAAGPLAGCRIAVAGLHRLERQAIGATLSGLGARLARTPAARSGASDLVVLAPPERIAGLDPARCIVLLTPAELARIEDFRGKGCRGYLIRPVRRAARVARLGAASLAAPAPPPSPGRPRSRPAAGRLTVLLAADNEINAALIRTLVGRLGHRPVV